MFDDDVTVPAGWYPDPMGLPQLRWWNNHAWTELTTEARPPLVMQQPAPTRLAYADDELPTRRQQREQREREEQYAHLATDEADARDAAAAQAPLDTTIREISPPVPETQGLAEVSLVDTVVAEAPHTVAEPQPTLADEDSFEPGDEVDEAFFPRSATTAVNSSTAQNSQASRGETDADGPQARAAAPRQSPGYTGPLWVIALVPLLQLVVGLLLLLGFGTTMGIVATVVVWTAPYVLVVLLAIADAAALKRAGFDHPAHWSWALLTAPVYLIARSVGVIRGGGGLGLGPLLVWAALGMLQIGSVLVVPGLVISALPQVFSAQAEQSVAASASIIGADLDVSCPATPPVLIGQQFSCSASENGEASHDVTVSLQRLNGWIDWRVDDWGVYTFQR